MPAKVKRTSSSGSSAEKRPSIVAVAEVAQVSIATVSRVLNQRGTVAPKLEKRVKAAILQTGYLPNFAARSLSSGRSRIFGVIISNLTNPFFPELLQSFEEAAVALGYEVLVASTAYDLQRMTNCIDRMLGRKVDGVAVMTFGIEGPLLNRFVDQSIPLVFMDEAPQGSNLYTISVDYQKGIRQAIQHLAILGHRKIAFVCGPEQQSSVARRRVAVEQAFSEIGLPLPPEYVFVGDHSLQSGQRALEVFLGLENPPTAIFCSNDLSAMGVMLAAGQRGLSIPNDLSLIGFDGIDLGDYIFPTLTSVLMSRKQIADAAVQALWKCVEGKPVGELKVDTQLLIRRTTAHPRGALQDLQTK